MWKSILATALLSLAAVTSAAETIVVSSVISGSPAEAAGLQEEDRLVELAGKKIASQADLQAVLATHKPGDTVPLTVERNGASVDLSLTFGERSDGGVSMGVRLAIMRSPGDDPGEATAGTVQCLAWIEDTYRAEAMIKELGLDFADDYRALLECVQATRSGWQRQTRFDTATTYSRSTARRSTCSRKSENPRSNAANSNSRHRWG